MAMHYSKLKRIYGTITGVLVAGEKVTGGTSLNTAYIAAVGSDYIDVKQLNTSGNFTMGETINGAAANIVMTGYVKIDYSEEGAVQIEARRQCGTVVDVVNEPEIGLWGKEVFITGKEQNLGAGSMIVYSTSVNGGSANESGAVTVTQNTALAAPVRFNYLGLGIQITCAKTGGTNCDLLLDIAIKRTR